ncbi:phosphotransferase [Nocardiopsis changdeensis]|uniref:phosphotransferase n=1 Tax=Nocardiopsis changdeensis TaxID=2831969 RepID=UPI003F45F02D
MNDPLSLPGGMMNTVTRRGDRVLRTAPATAAALHPHLRALPGAGFDGAPRPLALGPDGREELGFVEGEVALPPFPAWVADDAVLASAARLLRRYHDAAARVPVDTAAPWPADLADPHGGPLLCHNDPCVENLVFRGRRAAALIDFDLAAPGRPLWDVAALAYYMGPTLPPRDRGRDGLGGPGHRPPPARGRRRLRPVRRRPDPAAADGGGLPGGGPGVRGRADRRGRRGVRPRPRRFRRLGALGPAPRPARRPAPPPGPGAGLRPGPGQGVRRVTATR